MKIGNMMYFTGLGIGLLSLAIPGALGWGVLAAGVVIQLGSLFVKD